MSTAKSGAVGKGAAESLVQSCQQLRSRNIMTYTIAALWDKFESVIKMIQK